jgi:hypothetical protein
MFHLYFGKIPPEKFDTNIRYLYFVRQSNSAIDVYPTQEECNADMSGRFMVATIQKNTLEYLEEMINQLFATAFLHQFREPVITKQTLLPEKQAPPDETTEELQIGLMDLSRPSDFRLHAISAKREGFSVEGDDTHLKSTSSMSMASASKTSASSMCIQEKVETSTEAIVSGGWIEVT